ncbi:MULTISPECIES: hypothetical protein [unclassified Myroides]|uniref:hypothetical protein n=1 Tax=unclassified Myroides TaxID=2642485 RepID=UPI0021075B09|nr:MULTISPECIES: hypothetical protein [unclassified Myroides]
MRIKYIKHAVVLLAVLLGYTSCNKQKKLDGDNYIARVDDKYLDRSSLQNIVPPQTTVKDSIAMVELFINKWATKQLLMDAAAFNLSDDKKKEIDELVANFKSELLIKGYLEKLVQQSVDTVVRTSDLKEYYDKIKSGFKVDDMLVKLSYVNILNSNSHYNKVKSGFNGGKDVKYELLDQLSLQMKSYVLNDSLWVNVSQIYEKLPFINSENREQYLKNNTYFEVKDENSTYFVRISQVLRKGDIVPYSYLEPSLRLMVLNNRKMELLKQIEEDILKDAKKDKNYEIYQ